jgi:hypothetical protein
MKKNTTKKGLLESKLRQLIKREIHRLMEAEEEEQSAQEEPQPEEEAEEEQGLNPEFQQALSLFVRKLRSSQDSVEEGDLVDMMSSLMDTFASSNDSKLSILKQIRNNTVR